MAGLLIFLSIPIAGLFLGVAAGVGGVRWTIRILGIAAFVMGLVELCLIARWFGWYTFGASGGCYDIDGACQTHETFMWAGWLACIGLVILIAIAGALLSRRQRMGSSEWVH